MNKKYCKSISDGADHKFWAHTFASIVEEFIWIHSGSDNGGDLNAVFREALNAMTAYKKQATRTQRPSLKESIRSAHELAIINQLDPWTLVLKTIAERADDWTLHATDDNETTQDIKDWLNYEASLK